jgi:effector-binding domain-containing protein
MEFIEKNRLEICGNAFEEYPLNEVSVPEHDNYLTRVMIPVRDKKQRQPKTPTPKTT